jgi:hypothetical protein
MLLVGIITVDELIQILNLSPEAGNALKLVISRVQEVSGNILHIISQLISKLLSFAGVDSDLSKIHIDINAPQTPPEPIGSSVGGVADVIKQAK